MTIGPVKPQPSAALALRWLALLLAAFLSLPAQGGCRLRAAWAQEPPYSMRNAQGEVVGIVADLLSETLRRLDCEVVWVEQPWARALVELSAGRLDVIGGISRRPEREATLHFARPTMSARNLLFVHHDAAVTVQGLRHLTGLLGRNFRLGVQIGWAYGGDFDTLAADPAFKQQLTQASSRQSLWKMIELRRLDGLIADEYSGRYELAQMGLTGVIQATELVVNDAPWSTAFSRRTVEVDFVHRFEAAAEAMRLDGSQARILRRYAPQLQSAAPGSAISTPVPAWRAS